MGSLLAMQLNNVRLWVTWAERCDCERFWLWMLVYIVLVLYVGLARCSRVIRSRKLRSFISLSHVELDGLVDSVSLEHWRVFLVASWVSLQQFRCRVIELLFGYSRCLVLTLMCLCSVINACVDWLTVPRVCEWHELLFSSLICRRSFICHRMAMDSVCRFFKFVITVCLYCLLARVVSSKYNWGQVCSCLSFVPYVFLDFIINQLMHWWAQLNCCVEQVKSPLCIYGSSIYDLHTISAKSDPLSTCVHISFYPRPFPLWTSTKILT